MAIRQSLVEGLPLAAYAPFLPTLWGLLFTRLQTSRTPKCAAARPGGVLGAGGWVGGVGWGGEWRRAAPLCPSLPSLAALPLIPNSNPSLPPPSKILPKPQ